MARCSSRRGRCSDGIDECRSLGLTRARSRIVLNVMIETLPSSNMPCFRCIILEVTSVDSSSFARGCPVSSNLFPAGVPDMAGKRLSRIVLTADWVIEQQLREPAGREPRKTALIGEFS